MIHASVPKCYLSVEVEMTALVWGDGRRENEREVLSPPPRRMTALTFEEMSTDLRLESQHLTGVKEDGGWSEGKEGMRKGVAYQLCPGSHLRAIRLVGNSDKCSSLYLSLSHSLSGILCFRYGEDDWISFMHDLV